MAYTTNSDGMAWNEMDELHMTCSLHSADRHTQALH